MKGFPWYLSLYVSVGVLMVGQIQDTHVLSSVGDWSLYAQSPTASGDIQYLLRPLRS